MSCRQFIPRDLRKNASLWERSWARAAESLSECPSPSNFKNTGGRPAGSITAALFLREFAGSVPWVHLDIAGTAWAEEAKPYQPKGPTGVAVRTLAELAFTMET